MVARRSRKGREKSFSARGVLQCEAISALGAIALRDAYSLLEDMAGKGKGAIRNPSAYVIGAVNKMTGGGGGGGGSDWGSRNIVGKGRAPAHGASLEQRIIDLNRSGIWGGEKIDVEAMMALKRLSDGEAPAACLVFGACP